MNQYPLFIGLLFILACSSQKLEGDSSSLNPDDKVWKTMYSVKYCDSLKYLALDGVSGSTISAEVKENKIDRIVSKIVQQQSDLHKTKLHYLEARVCDVDGELIVDFFEANELRLRAGLDTISLEYYFLK